MKIFRQITGFTIVELMVVIVILGIITAIGVPSFNTVIRNNRIAAITNDINSTLQFARAEAVRLGGKVHVTAIDNSIDKGFAVWIDKNKNNKRDDGEELRVLTIEPDSLNVAADVGGVDLADLNFSFNARGESSLANTLTLNICDDRIGNYGRQLELLVSGAVRLKTDVACNG